MKLQGRNINSGQAEGEALVLDVPFSFVGDFEVATGQLVLEGHPLNGQSIAGKVLVCPTGKGGTIAPFLAYQAMRNGTAPVAIVCDKADPMLCECAVVIDIPIVDGFAQSPLREIRNGQRLCIAEGQVTIEA